jgi:hypothetical protein
VRRVKDFQHLEVVEVLPQGVRAKVFSKRRRVVEKIKGRKPSKYSKEGKAKYFEVLSRHCKFVLQVNKFVEEYLVIRRNHQGRTDGRNPLRRIHEFP